MSSDGSFIVGLFPDLAPLGVVDLAGVHYDIVLPDTGFTVTGARLRIVAQEPSSVMFGTALQLPEPSFVGYFVTAAFLGCLAHRLGVLRRRGF